MHSGHGLAGGGGIRGPVQKQKQKQITSLLSFLEMDFFYIFFFIYCKSISNKIFLFLLDFFSSQTDFSFKNIVLKCQGFIEDI